MGNTDKRPRKQDGELLLPCVECKVEQNRCRGFCIFQKFEKKEEQEEK